MHPNNDREAAAITILRRWLEQGFSIRHTITEALLKLESKDSVNDEYEILADISRRVNEILEIANNSSGMDFHQSNNSYSEKLSDEFTLSIVKVAKPGLTIAKE